MRTSLAQSGAQELRHSSTDARDDLQRSARDDDYSLVADHGVGRGENIYFYKCWMCHNKYAQSAPYLGDLYPAVDTRVRQTRNGLKRSSTY